jgi:sec-independent protein translocase protein TatC
MRESRAADDSMPFLDHLEELRWRLIWCLVAVGVGVAIGFVVALRFDIIARLETPILPFLEGRRVVATNPTDGLTWTVNAALWVGAVLAFPVVMYQVWLFLSPALYVREKRLLIAALGGGVALFALGAAFAFVVVLPMMLPWLFALFGEALEPMITAENYFGLVFSLVLSFGLAFELPIVVLLLAAAGLVTPQLLRRYRRHAIVGIVIAGAVLTPGDAAMGSVALACPLYILYELSVGIATIMARFPIANAARALLFAPLLLVPRRRTVRAAI